MLDLTVRSQKLGQGRASAEMTLAAPHPADAPYAPGAPASAPAPAEAAAEPSRVDARLVAREVYRLLRQELALRQQRRGGRV